MSFFKKLTDMVLSGKMPTLDNVTDLAKEGMKTAMLTPLQQQISSMHWDWREAGQSWNKGTGNAVRNWEQGGDEDLILAWQAPSQEVVEYVMVVAWRGWGFGFLNREHEEFNPDYIDAMFGDRLSTQRIARFDAKNAPQNAVRLPAGDFFYLKLMGVTTDGTYVEITDYSLAGAAKRAEKDDLPDAPTGDLPRIELPDGTREVNDFEAQFKPTKK